jgi:hypothetical protein
MASLRDGVGDSSLTDFPNGVSNVMSVTAFFA